MLRSTDPIGVLVRRTTAEIINNLAAIEFEMAKWGQYPRRHEEEPIDVKAKILEISRETHH